MRLATHREVQYHVTILHGYRHDSESRVLVVAPQMALEVDIPVHWILWILFVVRYFGHQ
jgi:hypothetical protein